MMIDELIYRRQGQLANEYAQAVGPEVVKENDEVLGAFEHDHGWLRAAIIMREEHLDDQESDLVVEKVLADGKVLKRDDD